MITSAVTSSWVGGADSPRLKYYSMVAAWLCIPFVIPIPFANNYQVFAVLVWFVLFIGSFILPIVQSQLLSVIPVIYKGTGNSFATLGYILLGYLPAPILYGFIAQFTNDNKTVKENLKLKKKKPLSRIPMAVIVYTVIIMVIMYTIVTKN